MSVGGRWPRIMHQVNSARHATAVVCLSLSLSLSFSGLWILFCFIYLYFRIMLCKCLQVRQSNILCPTCRFWACFPDKGPTVKNYFRPLSYYYYCYYHCFNFIFLITILNAWNFEYFSSGTKCPCCFSIYFIMIVVAIAAPVAVAAVVLFIHSLLCVRCQIYYYYIVFHIDYNIIMYKSNATLS